VAFFFLHRRYKRKLRAEDRADEEKYRSMDFGMDLAYGGGRKKKTKPEMSGAKEIAPRNVRGLSMEAGSPYLFPGGRGSKESLDTLARETYDADHRYRQVGGFGKGDDMSIRSPTPRARADTSSTLNTSPFDGASNANLLGNAQSFPNSAPPRSGSLPYPPGHPQGYPMIQEPEKAMTAPLSKSAQSKTSGGLAPGLPEPPRASFVDQTAFRQSNNYLRGFIHSREPSVDDDKHSPPSSNGFDSNASTVVGSFGSRESPKIFVADTATKASPPASATRPSPAEKTLPADPRATFVSMEASIHDASSASFMQNSNPNSYFGDLNFGDTAYKVTPPSPSHSQLSHGSKDVRDSASTYATLPPRGQSLAAPMPEIQERRESQYLGDLISSLDYNPNRLSVLMRPLPPDDPSENPEERANRIRSFYKEYFDESNPSRQQHQQHAPMPDHLPDSNNYNHQQHGANYYEDYDTEYMNGGYGVYDKQSQGFVVAAPFAQPITRRAMTPPPRAPPRFQGQSRGRASSGANPYAMPPRGQSSMSNYHSKPGPGSARGSERGSDRGRTPNRKPMPPPSPLVSLKTPHLLKDDSALYSAFDLAPPPSYRDRQHGRRPDSPLGTERSYSPAFRAHVPLNSAFDELSPMPSP